MFIDFTPDSSSVMCASVRTNDDNVLESNEVFPFSLQSEDVAIDEIIPDSGQITLLDNDRKFN